MKKVSIMQHNTNRNPDVMQSCIEIAIESAIDFILVQEPWIAFDIDNAAYTVSHPAYYCILPESSSNIRPRVAIFARKHSIYTYCVRTDLVADSDIIIIDVSGSNIETFQIVNIYNERSLDEESDNSYTVERSLQNINLSMETLIAGDLNAHHSWWNSSITNSIRADSLISWLNHYNCELINESDIQTCTRSANSVIDLAFATQKLYSLISDWHIDESNASGSDHEIIKFYIRTNATELVDNPLCSEHFNLNKADWKKFSEYLLIESQNVDFSHLNSISKLNSAALQLQNLIYAAAEKSIPKRRFSEKYSKCWWSEELRNLRRNYSHLRRIWKRTHSQDSHLQYLNARNQYFHEIKLAKQSSWNDFLEHADSEQVFKAYKYCKQRRIEKTPVLQYNDQKMTTFNGKCQAFLNSLLPANSANSNSNSVNLNNNIAVSADFATDCINSDSSSALLHEDQSN